MQKAELVHGTVVDIAGRGVLLRGPSGSGKSDLALRLIDRGACLISDDQTYLQKRTKGLYATAPKRLRGFMEVRGIGLVSMPVTGGSFLKLIVDLVGGNSVPRLPENQQVLLCDQKIHQISLNAFEYSVPIKIELAVESLSRIGGEGPSV